MKYITLENLTSFATKFSGKITEKFVKKVGKGCRRMTTPQQKNKN